MISKIIAPHDATHWQKQKKQETRKQDDKKKKEQTFRQVIQDTFTKSEGSKR